MLRVIDWKNLTMLEQQKLLQRSVIIDDIYTETVRNVIIEVRKEGDTAIRQLTKKFDNVDVENLQVTPEEITLAFNKVDKKTLKAIERSITQLENFHNPQRISGYAVMTGPGITCEMQYRPLQRVGLYVPGGSAPLVSTMLMLGIPAKIAGCPQRILCSPVQKDGDIDPNILVAANLCGIETIFKMGGAQAIAAMAYGTESVPKIDKIFGPGNKWVTAAKQLVAQDPKGAAFDLPAGPSEVMIIADNTANPTFIAADLLSQAEHDTDSQAILICTEMELAQQVDQEISRQIKVLQRANIIQQSLKNSCAIVVENIDQAIDIVNNYAPEHLLLQLLQPQNYKSRIQNAGAVFVGRWSAEAVGDYASGTNHVLPTYGYARAYSGLSVKDFMKTITFQEITLAGLKDIAPTVMQLAELEGLTAHVNAVAIRLTGEM